MVFSGFLRTGHSFTHTGARKPHTIHRERETGREREVIDTIVLLLMVLDSKQVVGEAWFGCGRVFGFKLCMINCFPRGHS